MLNLVKPKLNELFVIRSFQKRKLWFGVQGPCMGRITSSFFYAPKYTYLAAVTKAQQAGESGLRTGKEWYYDLLGLLRRNETRSALYLLRAGIAKLQVPDSD